jgi:hypothetical protein
MDSLVNSDLLKIFVNFVGYLTIHFLCNYLCSSTFDSLPTDTKYEWLWNASRVSTDHFILVNYKDNQTIIYWSCYLLSNVFSRFYFFFNRFRSDMTHIQNCTADCHVRFYAIDAFQYSCKCNYLYYRLQYLKSTRYDWWYLFYRQQSYVECQSMTTWKFMFDYDRISMTISELTITVPMTGILYSAWGCKDSHYEYHDVLFVYTISIIYNLSCISFDWSLRNNSESIVD